MLLTIDLHLAAKELFKNAVFLFSGKLVVIEN